MYKDYPVVLASLIAQNEQNWEGILIHDGPCDGTCSEDEKEIERYKNEPRIKFFETDRCHHDYGHAAREYGLGKVAADSEFIVFTGADNYYIPDFLKYMIQPFKRPEVGGVYCNCLHNIIKYEKMECTFAMAHIDSGNFMTRTKYAQIVGWKYRNYEADWMFMRDIARLFCTTPQSIQKIDRILFVHN